MGSRLLRREHIVAASLVGAVIVVVGYASGFGVRPVIGSQAPGGGSPVRPPAAAQPPTTTPTTTAPPAQPAGNGNRQVVPRSPLPAPPQQPQPTPTPPQHPRPPVPPAPAPPPTPPPTPCVPGLVPAALDTLLATLSSATDALGLPLLGGPAGAPLPPLPLLGGPGGGPVSPIGSPLPSLLGGPAGAPPPLVGAPAAGQGPLDGLIGTCPPAVPPTGPPR